MANSLDDVGKAYDIVQSREDIPITMSLGRHMMDSLVSFYLRTPTGFDMAFGAGGDALTAHLLEITEKIIREEVHASTEDAEEVEEPRRLR